jgi:hypothetical protein
MFTGPWGFQSFGPAAKFRDMVLLIADRSADRITDTVISIWDSRCIPGGLVYTANRCNDQLI